VSLFNLLEIILQQFNQIDKRQLAFNLVNVSELEHGKMKVFGMRQ
jgi:hypothetical protein